MKFGQKQTMKDKMSVAESRYGKTLGASKGKAALPKVKITPSGTNPIKGKVGVKIKAKF